MHFCQAFSKNHPPALPCFRLANALYALLRAGFSCSARAAALRITCFARPAQGHDRKKVSASSAAALLQQARPPHGRWERPSRSVGPPPHGRRAPRAATSASAPWSARPSGCNKRARPMVGAPLGLQQALAPWSARPSGCDKRARPMVGASLGLRQPRPPYGRRAPRAATSVPAPLSARPSGCNKCARPMVGASLGLRQPRPPYGRRERLRFGSAVLRSFGIKKEHPVRMLLCYGFPVVPCAASSLIRSEILREIRTNASASSSPMISRRLCASSSERSCTAR